MKMIQTLGLVTLLAISSISVAEMDKSKGMNGMPMECKQKHKGMMSPEKMAKMKEMQQMKKKHMQAMEQRLANIEALLKELVELQKKK